MITPRPTTVQREWRDRSDRLMGLVVIASGVLFLLHDFVLRLAFLEYRNWWAILILLGAIVPLSLVYRHHRALRGIDANVVYYLTSTAVIVTIGFIFLLPLRWNRWWPLFVIYGGLWMLARHPYRPRHTTTGHDPVE